MFNMAERFHPSAKGQIIKIVFVAIVLTVAVFFLGKYLGNLGQLFIIVIWIATFVLALLARGVELFKTIEVGETSIKVITGVLNVKSMLVPYDRITEVRSSQTLFQRFIGLGTLEVDTAGTSQIEITVPDVPENYLEQIINNIEQKTGKKVEKV